MANWNNPTVLSVYTDVLSELKARDVDALTLAESPTNLPTGAMRWNRTNDRLEEWSGAAWVIQVLDITGGGTGANTAGGARTALGLGTMATQNSNAVTITGGAISGLSGLGVVGDISLGGGLVAGSGPTTVLNTAGQVFEAAIADANILARIAGNETISGNWTFSNIVTGNITGNAATVTNGVYTNSVQAISGRKSFSANQNTSIATATTGLGGIELTGDGTNASFLTFHRPGSHAVYFGLDTDNALKVGGYSLGAFAYPVILSNNIGSYAPGLTGTGASGTWGISITGSAPTLTTPRNINGVSFNGSADITINAAASGLTGATLAAGVVNSSLTGFGTVNHISYQNGAAGTPAIRFASNSDAGMYYNAANPTLEIGYNFNDSGTRAVIRAKPSAIDMLINGVFPIEFQATQIISQVELYSHHIKPNVDNTYSLGATGRRYVEVWATNGTIQTSDIRHKRNHGPIENPLELLRRTETLIASWLSGPDNLRFPALSAQNIKEVWDDALGTEIVKVDIFDNHCMYYERMIPNIIAILKALDAQVQRLSQV